MRDTVFMESENPRPSAAKTGADPRGSLYRDHVLLGIQTHCEAFDAMYAGVRRWQPELSRRIMNKTVEVWRQSHPDEPFFPVSRP